MLAKVGISPEAFIKAHPRLYHMAEAGSWGSIAKNGLMSTEALLDLFDIRGAERQSLLAERRPKKVVIKHQQHGTAVIRDNIPILDSQLGRVLQGGLTTTDWYRILNRKVFFWVSERRLMTLLGARAYRLLSHDVLVVDTESLLERHMESIVLSPINSGNTRPNPQPRGPDTFLPLAQYPYDQWQARRRNGGTEPVVELAVDYSVPDITNHTICVQRRQHGKKDEMIWARVAIGQGPRANVDSRPGV